MRLKEGLLKFVRAVIPFVLLCVAVPAFALCGPCDINCNCLYDPSWGSGCKAYDPATDCCKDNGNPCGGFVEEAEVPMMLAAEYEIATVEVVTPAGRTLHSDTVRVADAATAIPATR
jgi:hypothetical protein